MTDRKEYVQRIDKELESLEGTLKELSRKTEDFGEEMKEKAQKHVSLLEEQHQTLEQRLKETKVDSEEAWQQFKNGFDDATSTLKTNIERTVAAFQK